MSNVYVKRVFNEMTNYKIVIALRICLTPHNNPPTFVNLLYLQWLSLDFIFPPLPHPPPRWLDTSEIKQRRGTGWSGEEMTENSRQ